MNDENDNECYETNVLAEQLSAQKPIEFKGNFNKVL